VECLVWCNVHMSGDLGVYNDDDDNAMFNEFPSTGRVRVFA
jgi:hypothetical protein